MTIVHGELHHCSVTGAFQRCVSLEEGHEILREIHEGVAIMPDLSLLWLRIFVMGFIGDGSR